MGLEGAFGLVGVTSPGLPLRQSIEP